MATSSELQQKIDSDDRINGIFRPELALAPVPPKAVNAFSDGVSPESVGSGQLTGIESSGAGYMKWDTTNNRIIISDGTNDRVVIGFLPGKF